MIVEILSCVSGNMLLNISSDRSGFLLLNFCPLYIFFGQAEELKKALWQKDVPAEVYVGMRYWHPFTEEAIEQVDISFIFMNYVADF